MTKLQFNTNKPVSLALHSIEGKERDSQFGGLQHMFTCDKGVFYVSETVGRIITDQCRKLDVKPGDTIEICKAEIDAGRGRKSIQWLVGFPAQEEAPVTPAPPALAPKPVAVAQTAAQAASQPPAWTDHLLATTNALTEVYSRALQHANSLQSGIRPDDVRALMTTAFINMANKSKEQNRVAA